MSINNRMNSYSRMPIEIILLILLGALSAFKPQACLLVVGAVLLIIFSWFETRLFCLFIFSYIVLFPKISIVSVPGTYIGIRGEDLFLALFLLEFLLKYFVFKYDFSMPSAIRKISNIFFLYVLACLLSVFFGILNGTVESPLLGLLYAFRKFEYFSLIYVALVLFSGKNTCKSNQQLRRFIDLSTVAIIAIGVLQKLGLVGAFSLGVYSPIFTSRIMSTFSGPYEFSGYLLLITPLYVYELFKKQKYIKSSFYLIMIVYGIYLTQSRTSLVVFGVIVILEGFRLSRSRALLMIIGSLILVLIMLGGGLFKGAISAQSSSPATSSAERFESLNLSEMATETKYAWDIKDFKTYQEVGPSREGLHGSDDSYSVRLAKWFNLLDGFFQHPFLGLGLSATGEAVDGNYIRLLAESGVVGTALWAIVYFEIYVEARKRLIRQSLLATVTYYGLISLFLGAVFIDVFESSKIAMTFWFFAGWMLSNIETSSVENEDGKVLDLQ